MTPMKVALVGNPNVGKSVLFNRLTGTYVTASNYPGTTVDVVSGWMDNHMISDAPGIYSLAPRTEEHKVAWQVIRQADMIVNVVSAPSLDRDLFLTAQLAELRIPMVVALNMADEANRLGMSVDIRSLERELGVSVIPTVAVTGQGIGTLRRHILRASPSEWRAARPAIRSPSPGALRASREKADDAYDQAVSQRPGGAYTQTSLADLLIKPLWGEAAAAVVLALIYFLMAGVVVGIVVEDVLETRVFGQFYRDLLETGIGSWAASIPIVHEILMGDFGLLTMGLTYLLGLILPMVFAFYGALGLLEDTGYLPRLAVVSDRFLTRVGLNGRAVFSLVTGLGCVTLALMATRTLASRERRIACALLCLAVPCSAQMAIIAAMIIPLGFGYLSIYSAAVGGAFLIAGHALSALIPGSREHLLLDIPPLRWPRLNNLAKKTAARTLSFVKEAAPFFALGSVALALLENLGTLELLSALLEPITEGWLGLPREAALALMMGIIRRDLGAAGLYQLSLTPMQSVVGLTALTLSVPCLAATLILAKERGVLEGIVVWGGALCLGLTAGGLLHNLVKLISF